MPGLRYFHSIAVSASTSKKNRLEVRGVHDEPMQPTYSAVSLTQRRGGNGTDEP